MAGSNSLTSGVREDDGGGAVAVYRYGDCTYVSPGAVGNLSGDRVALPTGYKIVIVEAVGGDLWINQGSVSVTAVAPAGGTGLGRYLAQGKEVALPVGAGAFVAGRAVSGSPTLYVYGLGA